MAKFDEQLSRMEYLMGYRTPTNTSKSSNIEYSTAGADGKIYGIIKEGTKYYIKTTESGKENLSESYDYINGFNNRKETEYKSYNEASKQLELKLMSLNEAYGVHKDVSTVDFNRSTKVLTTLTEEARKELDRVNQIMENSGKIGIADNIGNHGNPEGKGSSTGANTEKNNTPFDEKKSEDMSKDSVAEETSPAKANDGYTDVSKKVEADLQSDKMKKGGNEGDMYKDAHDDLDGEGVADKHPSGGKAVVVNVNESYMGEADDIDLSTVSGDDITVDDFEDVSADDIENGDIELDDPLNQPNPLDTAEEMPQDTVGDDVVGMGDEDENDDLDSLLEEFDALISGEDKVMTGKNGSLPVQSWDKMEGSKKCSKCGSASCTCGKDACNKKAPTPAICKGLKHDEDALTGPHCGGEVLSWDKMNESQKKTINTIVEGVCDKLFNKQPNKKNITAENKFYSKVRKMVNEEVTKLDAWGKHPKYGKQPMTTPNNTEVLKGTADKDWNDDSVKGSERYGRKIGNGAPFDKVVDILTDSVLNIIKENFRLKKK